MNCDQHVEQLPFNTSNLKVAEMNLAIQHKDRLPLPPPSQFCRKSKKSGKSSTKTAEVVSAGPTSLERLAAHKAAISRMILNDELAQWTSDCEVSDAWMWEQQLMTVLTTEL
jgi:hypothetical protein